MKFRTYNYFLYFFLLTLMSCIEPQPNLDKYGNDKLEVHETYVGNVNTTYRDTVYIPIYSEIYSESRFNSTLLTATLSIRNTSLTDSIFVNTIDYYNNDGVNVKSFIDKTVLLKPMASIDYVIDRDDDTGGLGANFILDWSSRKDCKPIFQAVMIGTSGQHGLSFVVNGQSLKNK